MKSEELIKGCIRAEKAAASVYKKLKKRFPDAEEFWSDLFNDEVEHLSFLNDVKSLGLESDLQKSDMLPAKESISATTRMAADIKKKADARSFTMKKALGLVLKMEESVVETYTNRVIARLIACEGEKAYKQLVAEEKKHVRKIKKMMQ